MAGPCTKPEQVHWNFKLPRDIHVVMEVYGQKDEVATEWEEQAMAPGEQTRYHAIAARLNFLAVDRPDLLYAAKECSRRTSKPRNMDWEAIKRICRYLSACPGWSIPTGGRTSQTPSLCTVSPTGADVGRPGSRLPAHASSTETI